MDLHKNKPDINSDGVKIKVLGVGGGGGNAVNRMIKANVKGVDFVSVNTDKQALIYSQATEKIQVGKNTTKGMGAGSSPEKGHRAAEESKDELEKSLQGVDMVFITAGMGGGTGTGAAPIIAKVARDLGILTVGIVTKPFAFEGRKRMEQAENGITALREHVDSLIVIPNERLKKVNEHRITLANAFQVADDILRQGVESISKLIKVPGLINLDFADVTAVMKDAGYAYMGIGHANGKEKAIEAAQAALSSPLLETTINGATGVIINIISSPDIGLDEIEQAASYITNAAHPDANIIWGAVLDDDLKNEMIVTVVATGFNIANKSDKINSREADSSDIYSFGEKPDFITVLQNGTSQKFSETNSQSSKEYSDILRLFEKKSYNI